MREAWKRETYVRSQSFSSESAVKYLHVGRRKIQISPRLPLGEQGQSIALPIPKGQQRQSNARPPHALPPPPPRRHDIDRSITLAKLLVQDFATGKKFSFNQCHNKAKRNKICFPS